MAEEFEGEVIFFGASNNDTIEDGRAYQEEFGVPYDLAHAPEVWDLFGVPYQPVTIVLNGKKHGVDDDRKCRNEMHNLEGNKTTSLSAHA